MDYTCQYPAASKVVVAMVCRLTRLAQRSYTHWLPSARAIHVACVGKTADKSPFAQGWITDDGRTTVFGDYADEYSRLRPDYPDSVFESIVSHCQAANSELNLNPLSDMPAQALDLGTGTGRAALKLHNAGFIVTAAEPDVGMLQQARRNLADCRFINFMNVPAENTGFAHNRFDCVTCFQAWHWVDNTAGLAEVRRVLRDNGRFLVAWNDRDLSDPKVQQLESVIEKYNPHYNRDARQCDTWEERLQAEGHFELVEFMNFPNQLPIADVQHLIDLAHTFSYVKNALTPVQLQAFDDDMHATFEGLKQWEMPLLTRTYVLKPGQA